MIVIHETKRTAKQLDTNELPNWWNERRELSCAEVGENSGQSRMRVSIVPPGGGDRRRAYECVRSTERRKHGGEWGLRDIAGAGMRLNAPRE